MDGSTLSAKDKGAGEASPAAEAVDDAAEAPDTVQKSWTKATLDAEARELVARRKWARDAARWALEEKNLVLRKLNEPELLEEELLAGRSYTGPMVGHCLT